MNLSREVIVEFVGNEQVQFSDGTTLIRQRANLHPVFGPLFCGKLLQSREFVDIFVEGATQADSVAALAKSLGSLSESKHYKVFHLTTNEDGFQIVRDRAFHGDVLLVDCFPPENTDALTNSLLAIRIDVNVLAAYESNEEQDRRTWVVPADVINAQGSEIHQYFSCNIEFYKGEPWLDGQCPDTEFEQCRHFGVSDAVEFRNGRTRHFCKSHEEFGKRKSNQK